MLLIIIIGLIILVGLAILFFVGSWSLDSVTKDLQSHSHRILGKKAQKDARTILQLGYIVDRKWYNKTRENLNALGDWESQELWKKLGELEQAEKTKILPVTTQ